LTISNTSLRRLSLTLEDNWPSEPYLIQIANEKIMKRIIAASLLIALLTSCNSGDPSAPEATSTKSEVKADKPKVDLVNIDTDEALIATALMAAPEASRAECTVIGYNMKGDFVTLKKGTNELICLADDPAQKGFSAACYHKNLEPFMARGRALKAQGKSAKEIFDIREQEAKAGTLDMGGTGSTLHIYYGAETEYDPTTNVVNGAKYRYVVYMPWATAESTGLPERPIEPNHPWIMNPGTHRAHIMISPINGEET